MARTAVIAISRRGSALAHALTASLGGDTKLYVERRFHAGGDESVPFDLPVRPVLRRLFNEYQQLVLFMPVGAAVRLLASYLQDKKYDPAVVCVDDAGRFAVSLLSGHLGGADRLAEEVGQALGAAPVVTSASHVTGTLAVDLLGSEFGWRMEAEPAAITRASAAVVNGDPVGIFQEAGEPDWWPPQRPLPKNITVYPSLESLLEGPCVAALIVSDRQSPVSSAPASQGDAPAGKTTVHYRPRSLVAGIGCRRGVVLDELEELLTGTFRRHNLALDSLGCIATADLKKSEPGIQELAEKFDVPLRCYTGAELNQVFGRRISLEAEGSGENSSNTVFQEGGDQEATPGLRRPTPSPVAHRLLGLWGVSEPAALLASGADELLVPRVKTSRATIAVARMSFPSNLSRAGLSNEEPDAH